MTTQTDWEKAQRWEKLWHNTCSNSLGEELKQLVYAKKMGLVFTPNPWTPYNIVFNGERVVDIGGGAYSLLLKAKNFSKAVVVDPLDYPDWVYARYHAADIVFIKEPGERFDTTRFDFPFYDVTLIYNCLQHTQDPKKIISNILSISKIVRLFEWIDTEQNTGHPQVLTEQKLNAWLGGNGKVEFLNENGCVGKCYYGVFKGKYYDG